VARGLTAWLPPAVATARPSPRGYPEHEQTIEGVPGPDPAHNYLRYPDGEGELYCAEFEDTEVLTVYFGGVTTNLYLPRQYEPLMTLVRETVPRAAPALEVTVEGVAQPLHAPRGAAGRATGRYSGVATRGLDLSWSGGQTVSSPPVHPRSRARS
jgi:hypothetical protein